MPIHPIIEEAVRTGTVRDPQGRETRYHSGVTTRAGEALCQAASRLPPGARVLEIGMAFGTSSLQLLSGLAAGGGGTLTVVDPFQTSLYGGIGVGHVRRAGWGDRLTFLEKPSYLALPELLAAGERFDMIFIDGHHTFDYTFVDYFFADRLLKDGGLLGFHDVQMWSVSKVVRFLRTHKRYTLEKEACVPCLPVQRVRRVLYRLAQPLWYLRRMAGRATLREGSCNDGRGTLTIPIPTWGVREPLSYPDELQLYRKEASREVYWNEHHEF